MANKEPLIQTPALGDTRTASVVAEMLSSLLTQRKRLESIQIIESLADSAPVPGLPSVISFQDRRAELDRAEAALMEANVEITEEIRKVMAAEDRALAERVADV